MLKETPGLEGAPGPEGAPPEGVPEPKEGAKPLGAPEPDCAPPEGVPGLKYALEPVRASPGGAPPKMPEFEGVPKSVWGLAAGLVLLAPVLFPSSPLPPGAPPLPPTPVPGGRGAWATQPVGSPDGASDSKWGPTVGLIRMLISQPREASCTPLTRCPVTNVKGWLYEVVE